MEFRKIWKTVDEEKAHAFLTAEFKRRRKAQHGSVSNISSSRWQYFPPISAWQCYDGFCFSIQAGAMNYCSPREWDPSKWTAWEIGYPSAPDPQLMPWAEDERHLTNTVYPMVPSSVIVDVIESHGGLMGMDPLEELRSKVS
jgi:hypothetical protein